MPPRPATAAQRRELADILSEIDKRREAEGFPTLDDLAKKAGHSISTWHAWRRKNPTSPKFFDLRDFARAVGLDIRLWSDDGVLDVGSMSSGSDGGPEMAMHPETDDVVRLMEELPEQSRRFIRDAAFRANAELHSNPPEPSGNQGPPPARRS